MFKMKNKGMGTGSGFTLIELLLVIGILVILISATIIAINPFKQFAQANNASRMSGITIIMNAVYQNVVDNAGIFCPDVDGDSFVIPPDPTTITSEVDGVDLCSCIVPDYVSTLPVDPQGGEFTDCTDYNTEYTISRDGGTGRIEICAPNAELEETICLTR